MLKDVIIDHITESDWIEIIDGVIERAKYSDEGFIILRDLIQTPRHKIALELPTNIFISRKKKDADDDGGGDVWPII